MSAGGIERDQWHEKYAVLNILSYFYVKILKSRWFKGQNEEIFIDLKADSKVWNNFLLLKAL